MLRPVSRISEYRDGVFSATSYRGAGFMISVHRIEPYDDYADGCDGYVNVWRNREVVAELPYGTTDAEALEHVGCFINEPSMMDELESMY